MATYLMSPSDSRDRDAFGNWLVRQVTMNTKLQLLASEKDSEHAELGKGIWVPLGTSGVMDHDYNMQQKVEPWTNATRKSIKVVARCLRSLCATDSPMGLLWRACEGMFYGVTDAFDPAIQLRSWRLIVLRILGDAQDLSQLISPDDMSVFTKLAWLPACKVNSSGPRLPTKTIGSLASNSPLTPKMVDAICDVLKEKHSLPSISPVIYPSAVFKASTRLLREGLDKLPPQRLSHPAGTLKPSLVATRVIEGIETENSRDSDLWLLADVRQGRLRCFYYDDNGWRSKKQQ